MKIGKCIICEKPFRTNMNGRSRKTIRIPTARTCSKKCSKVYNRINKIYYQYYMKKLKELIT